MLQLREMATNVSLRTKLRELAGITEVDLARILAALEKLIPLSDPSLAAAPVAIPPLGGMLAPDHRALAFDNPPIANFWRATRTSCRISLTTWTCSATSR